MLDAHREHRPERRGRPIGTGEVGLRHHHDVGELHEPGLQRLDLVAHPGRLHDHRGVHQGSDGDLSLARADRLHQHHVEADPCEHNRRISRGGGEAAR